MLCLPGLVSLLGDVQAMEKLVDQGLVKHIGISNFSVKKIKDLLTYAHIKPAVHQIEVHPYFRNDYNINFCRSQVTPLHVHCCAKMWYQG